MSYGAFYILYRAAENFPFCALQMWNITVAQADYSFIPHSIHRLICGYLVFRNATRKILSTYLPIAKIVLWMWHFQSIPTKLYQFLFPISSTLYSEDILYSVSSYVPCYYNNSDGETSELWETTWGTEETEPCDYPEQEHSNRLK